MNFPCIQISVYKLSFQPAEGSQSFGCLLNSFGELSWLSALAVLSDTSTQLGNSLIPESED